VLRQETPVNHPLLTGDVFPGTPFGVGYRREARRIRLESLDQVQDWMAQNLVFA